MATLACGFFLFAFIIMFSCLQLLSCKFQKLAVAEHGSTASSGRVLAEYLLLNWFAIWAGGGNFEMHLLEDSTDTRASDLNMRPSNSGFLE